MLFSTKNESEFAPARLKISSWEIEWKIEWKAVDPFMKRLLFIALPFFVAGCEQTRPPSAEGLKKIAARTASGTLTTKLEARVQPEIPRAGEFSFWDLKIFDMEDKPDGARKEWKFFNTLPQTSSNATISEVLMRSWIVSRDGRVFLPARPKYQGYGSFNTDWTLPRPGAYTLFTEYQPAARGKIYPVEMAHWNFTVAPGKSDEKPLGEAPHWRQTNNPVPITLRGAASGEPAGTLSIENLPSKKAETRAVKISGAPDGASEMDLAARSSGGTFLHFARNDDGTFAVTFPKPSTYRVWAYFTLNGAPYAAPINQEVS